MANPQAAGSAAQMAPIPFGSKIRINPAMRLPRFDNGQSKAYEAFDAEDKTKKYIAIVCGVECLPRWSAAALYNKLADTSFMRMMGSGIITWPMDNSQRYVFLYAGGVGEALVEEGSINQVSWRHPDIIERFIQPMARILKEMEDKGFRHGAIRASNIFHGSMDKNKPVILGDCLSTQPGAGQPSIYLPIEKSLAEPMGRGGGSIKDDIYAFGVSLIVFLRKSDELEGVSDNEILRRRVEHGSYNVFIGNERFQSVFLEFLRGVLHDDPLLRWGLDEVFAWLDGTRMTPPPVAKSKKANRPLLLGGRRYLSPQLLALDIHKFPHDIADMIQNGSLTHWIEKSIDDSHLTERYSKSVERIIGAGNVADNKDYMVTQLRMALNPALPIYYKERIFSFDGLGTLLALDIYNNQDLSYFREILRLNILDQAVVLTGMPQNLLIVYLKQYDVCRSALQNLKAGFGIERCVYMLCKDAPCLSPKLSGYFVYNAQSALITYEALCAKGGEIALLLDRHSIAFFSVLDSSLMERSLYDLNDEDKSLKIAGNLRFFALIQQRTKDFAAMALAKVFADSLSGVYKNYKNKALQKTIQEGVENAAKLGDLITMSVILDDDVTLKKDDLGFRRAKYEYYNLQLEYNELNKRLSNKATYGLPNGRDAAAIVSWSISTLITLVVVFAHLSGYRMY